MFNFYRRFLPKAAHLLSPLIKFLEGHTKKKKSIRPTKKSESSLQWSKEAEKAFLDPKKALAEATLLKHPIPGAPLNLWTDASLFAIGSSLNQLSNETWEPIAFFSRKLSKVKQIGQPMTEQNAVPYPRTRDQIGH
ncbi:hypothetical protein AVEN_34911-1 [Araneus ventricosus]|uniref:Reverse transcriptase/retrotransposon-derived protein RNase H-like domain-containing protein n=1 Tax=Araneus ventricosus TaxID=182803 RepID=A0A4Y2V1S9_ARAVE|nr:hypothetical protein AVEN_991-1 [Araneus ventricosus]GBO18016.1 hypothetical protein AVEN_34911-1 [Araneus ventricosus]